MVALRNLEIQCNFRFKGYYRHCRWILQNEILKLCTENGKAIVPELEIKDLIRWNLPNQKSPSNKILHSRMTLSDWTTLCLTHNYPPKAFISPIYLLVNTDVLGFGWTCLLENPSNSLRSGTTEVGSSIFSYFHTFTLHIETTWAWHSV